MRLIPYRTKLWRGENFGEFGELPQFAKFFANIPDEARDHAVQLCRERTIREARHLNIV